MTNTDKMNQAIETMMEMGFSRHLAEKALKATHYSSVHAAIDHLLNHPELTRSKNNNHKRHRRKSQTNNNNNNNNNNQNHHHHHHKKNLNELVQEEEAEELEVNVNESSEEMDVNHNKDHTGSSNSSVSVGGSVGSSSSSSDSNDSSNNDHENYKYDESIAILIACENYANMEKLNGSLSAVRRLGHMLENGLGHYSERFPRVVYMLDDQVSSASAVLEQVRTSLSTVVNNGKMDVNSAQQNNAHQRNARVMIVLCGHSQVEQLKNSGTQEYFCCHGYRWGDESAGNKVHNALYYRDLLNVVEEYCDAKHVTLVFDCCFSRNLYSAENNNSISINNKRQSPRVDSRSNLRRSMEEECKCVLASGVAEESVQQRREISPMIDCLSDALSTTWYTQHPDGYCTFNEIAAHVQQQLCKRGEQITSSETTATSASDTIVKFGYLHEYKGGNMVFKLPTEYKLFDACPNSHMFEMRDSERWYNIQEFWPSGLYVGCWKNGVPNSEINLGWFTCPKNPLYSFHTFLAHKHGNKVIVYEFGVLDAVTRRARPESSVTAEALALGAPGCIVVTEWTINGRHVLPNPTLLYSEPSNCAGYITDLSSETDVEAPLAQIHWLRVTPRDAFQRASTNSVLDLSVLSGQCIPDPTSDVKWGGSETYMIASNNCHHYCYHLLCSLLSKRVEWPFLRLISKIK